MRVPCRHSEKCATARGGHTTSYDTATACHHVVPGVAPRPLLFDLSIFTMHHDPDTRIHPISLVLAAPVIAPLSHQVIRNSNSFAQLYHNSCDFNVLVLLTFLPPLSDSRSRSRS